MVALILSMFAAGCSNNTTADCVDECDSAAFFDCLNATEQAACREKCRSGTSRQKLDFIACNEAASPTCDNQCFALLGLSVGGGTGTCSGNDVTGCQASCDTIHFFSCFDAATLSTCRARCTSASTAQCTSFDACVATSDCPTLTSCWNAFR